MSRCVGWASVGAWVEVVATRSRLHRTHALDTTHGTPHTAHHKQHRPTHLRVRRPHVHKHHVGGRLLWQLGFIKAVRQGGRRGVMQQAEAVQAGDLGRLAVAAVGGCVGLVLLSALLDGKKLQQQSEEGPPDPTNRLPPPTCVAASIARRSAWV
jgi:hypothetical protein